MAEKQLYVAFLWHMHQPLYRNGVSGRYLLPWVRMHGIKDYYNMPAMLEKYPNVRQTFNLTPVLMMQVEDYVKNGATDAFLEITLKKASELTKEDKCFILYNFFMASWENMLVRCRRYTELLDKRGRHITSEQIEKVSSDFSVQEYLDLQVLFNLVWFDPVSLGEEPLRSLVLKDRNFTEEDKAAVIKKQMETLALIMPEYKKLQDAGQIEVTTSPFYHPILPLVYDTDIAKVPSPQIPMPEKRFSAPQDARKQVEKAVEFYKERFGKPPRGMWPSEGSVSEEILPAIEDAGIKWIATDEGILENSLKKPVIKDTTGAITNPEMLYKPYRFRKEGRAIDIIFRDHTLSDLIGFSYSRWKTEDAVNDFMRRLEAIGERTSKIPGDYLVSVVLDGENAWEYYPNDGNDFLEGIYGRLNSHKSVRCVTVSEFLDSGKVIDVLPSLSPGSWINRNFNIWIGDEEENKAWDHLFAAREFLVNYEGGLDSEGLKLKDPELSKAWEEIYAAEGSDWNWWYGDQNTSGYDDAFDILYRQHLSGVYSAVGESPPQCLAGSLILPAKSATQVMAPVDLIRPKLDGLVTDYYDWIAAGYYEIRKTGGTMHQAESIVRAVYYGFDMENIYLRIDLHEDAGKCEECPDLSFIIDFVAPKKARIMFTAGDSDFLLTDGSGKEKRAGTIAVKKIIEIKVPFEDLGFSQKDEVKFNAAVLKNGTEMERWPNRAPITFTLPSADYNMEHWSV